MRGAWSTLACDTICFRKGRIERGQSLSTGLLSSRRVKLRSGRALFCHEEKKWWEPMGREKRRKDQAAPEADGGGWEHMGLVSEGMASCSSRGFWGPVAGSSSEFLLTFPVWWVEWCYGLNVHVCPLNLCVESVIPMWSYLGEGGGGIKSWGWSLMNGIGALISRDSGCACLPVLAPHRVWTQQEEVVSKPGSSSGSADTWLLASQPLELWERNVRHFSLPVYCNLLYQPKPKYMVTSQETCQPKTSELTLCVIRVYVDISRDLEMKSFLDEGGAELVMDVLLRDWKGEHKDIEEMVM